MISIGNIYKVSDVLRAVAEKKGPDASYDLYWEDQDREATLDDVFLVAEKVQVTDDCEEIYPKSATDRGFWIYCSDELIQDVVGLAVSQKPTASLSDLLRCLEHYIRRDCFLDLGNDHTVSGPPAKALPSTAPEQSWQTLAIIPEKKREAYMAYAKMNHCNLLAAKSAVDKFLAERANV
ncbi:MAG: hypothetical protein FWC42_08380 [Proteobacteria bacterium]|nr:hypothetical protein [Pseudomonadota bacterium]